MDLPDAGMPVMQSNPIDKPSLLGSIHIGQGDSVILRQNGAIDIGLS